MAILARPASSSQQLSYGQVEQLWINAGGAPALAPLMAAIATAESGRNPRSLNDTPATGDYSVGLWQINYFGSMLQGRTREFGSPDQLLNDPNAQAKAAVAIYRQQGLKAWSTYSSGAYRPYLQGSVPPDANVPSSTPGTGTGGSSATQTSDSSSIDCLIKLPVLGGCLLTRQQGKQILGVLTMGAGGIVGALGILVLVGYGLAATRATERAQALVPAPVKAAAGRRRTERAATARREEATRRRSETAVRGELTRRQRASETEQRRRNRAAEAEQRRRARAAEKPAPKAKVPAQRKERDSDTYEGGE